MSSVEIGVDVFGFSLLPNIIVVMLLVLLVLLFLVSTLLGVAEPGVDVVGLVDYVVSFG